MDMKNVRFYLLLFETVPFIIFSLFLFGLSFCCLNDFFLSGNYLMVFYFLLFSFIVFMFITGTYNKIKCFRYDLNTTLTLMDDDKVWEYCSPQVNFRFKVGDIINVHRLKMLYPFGRGINFIITFSDGRRIYLTYEANDFDVHELMKRVPKYFLITSEWRLLFKEEDHYLD